MGLVGSFFLLLVNNFGELHDYPENYWLGRLQGESAEWVAVQFQHPNPSNDDWVAVFSPAKFKYAFFYKNNLSLTSLLFHCCFKNS